MKKFDYKQFVKPKKDAIWHPAMTGIYHENGFRVASDGSALVAIREQYPDENEGKIITPKGEELINAKFPKWRNVVNFKNPTPVPMDLQTLYRIVDENRTARKEKAPERAVCLDTNNGKMFFSPKNAERIAYFAERYEVSELLLWGERPTVHAARLDGCDGSVMMIMPGTYDDGINITAY